jgi:hypothetical protein
MADRANIDISTLRQLLAYDPETGKLTWLERPREMFPTFRAWRIWNGRYATTEALTTDCRGALQGNLFNRRVFAHRIAYAILRELERDLKMLLQSRTISETTKREIEALAAEAEGAINARYAPIAGTLDTHGLVVLVSERTVEAMQALGAVKSVTAETLASLVEERADRRRTVKGMVGQAGRGHRVQVRCPGSAGRHQRRDE